MEDKPDLKEKIRSEVDDYLKSKINYLRVFLAGLTLFLLIDGIAAIFGFELFGLYIKKLTVELSQKDERFQQAIIASIKQCSQNIIGTSYKDHFWLGPKPHQNEHFFPIYVSKDQKVIVLIEIRHLGAGSESIISMYIDSEEIPIRQNVSTQVINLTKYIEKVKDIGIHEFNENFHTISFRRISTESTDDLVSIKMLLNIFGETS